MIQDPQATQMLVAGLLHDLEAQSEAPIGLVPHLSLGVDDAQVVIRDRTARVVARCGEGVKRALIMYQGSRMVTLDTLYRAEILFDTAAQFRVDTLNAQSAREDRLGELKVLLDQLEARQGVECLDRQRGIPLVQRNLVTPLA